MAQLKESELKKQIKEKAFVPLYFLYGEEKYLISHYTEAIVNKVLGKSYSDFNFQAFDGGKASIDEIADAAQALPLFAERKCVLVKDLNVEALNAGELAKLYQLLEELSETTVLIISQSTLEIDAKRSAKWKKFIAAAEKMERWSYWKKRRDRFREAAGAVGGKERLRPDPDQCGENHSALRR